MMSDLDKLGQVADKTAKPMTDEELQKRVGGRVVAKGEGIHLSELDYALKKLHVGAGWDAPGVDTLGIDIDLAMFLLDKNDQTREDTDFVFYNNPVTCDGGVKHNGDCRTGLGDGDDESIAIDLAMLPFDVMKMVFVVSIYDAEMRDQNIGYLRNLHLRLVNIETGREILRFPVTEQLAERDSYGVILAEITREGPVWRFVAMAEPISNGGLGKVATQYGLMVTG